MSSEEVETLQPTVTIDSAVTPAESSFPDPNLARESEFGITGELVPIELAPDHAIAFRTLADQVLARHGVTAGDSTYVDQQEHGKIGEGYSVTKYSPTGLVTIETYRFKDAGQTKLEKKLFGSDMRYVTRIEIVQTGDGRTYLVKDPGVDSYPNNDGRLDETKQAELSELVAQQMAKTREIESRLNNRRSRVQDFIGKRLLAPILIKYLTANH